MKIRFVQSASSHVDFASGDELSVARVPEGIKRLLNNPRLDGKPVAILLDDEGEEVALADVAGDEKAVVGRVRRGART